MNKECEPHWGDPTPAFHDEGSTITERAGAAPLKQIVTIRLDVDTLAWFKAAGPGYQTRINQLLREHMQAQQAEADGAK